jgi:DNA-binding MarR family transcriptional regulator
MDVNVLSREIETFADIDPEMQVTTMLVFLYIAQRGVCTQKDVEIGLGLTNATVSRNVSYWCDRKSYQKEGIGYVERTEDPRDRRYKLLRLTKAGQKFYEKVRSDKHGTKGR